MRSDKRGAKALLFLCGERKYFYYMKVDMRAYESRLVSEKRHENKISTHLQKVLTKVLTNKKSSGIVIE